MAKTKVNGNFSWNMFVRKLSFPNAICFKIPFLVSSESNFTNVLMSGGDHMNWILVINAVADVEKQLLFNKEFAADSVVIHFLDIARL